MRERWCGWRTWSRNAIFAIGIVARIRLLGRLGWNNFSPLNGSSRAFSFLLTFRQLHKIHPASHSQRQVFDLSNRLQETDEWTETSVFILSRLSWFTRAGVYRTLARSKSSSSWCVVLLPNAFSFKIDRVVSDETCNMSKMNLTKKNNLGLSDYK